MRKDRNMYYITGDLHGRAETWLRYIAPALSSGDTLIVAGDFGVGFYDSNLCTDEDFYDWIAEQDFTVLFVDGNHENFDALGAYPVAEYHGGKVHVLRRNLLHLMRGEIYDLDGKSLFVFGGGDSADKAYRTPGKSWWPGELPNAAEYENARGKLAAHENQVDYIVTHTAPSETVSYLNARNMIGHKRGSGDEWELQAFLDSVQAEVRYGHWYFGHFHADADLWRNQSVLYNTIRSLESGNVLCRWEI